MTAYEPPAPEEPGPVPCGNCGKPSKALRRSWCSACYERWRLAGKPASGPPAPVHPGGPRLQGPCADCRDEQEKLTRGRCGPCYRKHLRDLRLAGEFTSKTKRPRQPVVKRILSKVAVDANGCWLYSGSLLPDGYAHTQDDFGRPVRVHRAVYLALVGPIPDGLAIDHLCSVRNCVNPAHLEAVTNAVNNQRAAQRRAERGERVRQRPRTHCPNGHAYTDDNTIVQPSGVRRCRACRRATDVRRRAAKRTQGSTPIPC